MTPLVFSREDGEESDKRGKNSTSEGKCQLDYLIKVGCKVLRLLRVGTIHWTEELRLTKGNDLKRNYSISIKGCQ